MAERGGIYMDTVMFYFLPFMKVQYLSPLYYHEYIFNQISKSTYSKPSYYIFMSKISVNFKCKNHCRLLNCIQCLFKSDKFHTYFSLQICFASCTF